MTYYNLIVLLFFVLIFITNSIQQDIDLNNLLINNETTPDDGSNTIDNSFQGQGIPRELTDLIPTIEDIQKTTRRPQRPRKPNYSKDVRIPPGFQHLYPEESSTVGREKVRRRSTKFNFLDFVPPPSMDYFERFEDGNGPTTIENNETTMEETIPSTTTTTVRPRRLRPRGRRPMDPAARARMRQRLAGNQVAPPGYNLTGESSTKRPRAGRYPLRGFPDRIPPGYQQLYQESTTTRRTRLPDRIPPGFQHLYSTEAPEISGDPKTAIFRATLPSTESRFGTGDENGETTSSSLDSSGSNTISLKIDANSVRRLNSNIENLLRSQEKEVERYRSFEERISNIENQINQKYSALESKLNDIATKHIRLENQNNRLDSALYILRRNSMQIKKSLEKLENSSNPELSQDLISKIDRLVSTVDSLKQSGNPSYVNDGFLNDDNSIYSSDKMLPENCLDIQSMGYRKPDVYRIYPKQSSISFFVFCDNGWAVIQNRSNGEVDFRRNWNDYKLGFGNLAGEFWLGLEKIHILTNYDQVELLIELEDFQSQKRYAYYAPFSIGSEIEGYPLAILGNYKGNAGDSLRYHAGQKFSTYDNDLDSVADGNCAEQHAGAWWYKNCDRSNLNGLYLNGEVPLGYDYQGMYWSDFHGGNYSLKSVRMLIRPISSKI